MPAGATINVDRGIEQGDPLGGIQAGAVILDAVEGARAEIAMLGVTFFDCWRLDDGQPFCAEEHVDVILRTLDKHFEAAGATQGVGAEVKSVGRVLGGCPRDDEGENDWLAPYVRNMC